MQLLVGTAKGLITYLIEPGKPPKRHQQHFLGFPVNFVFADERSGRWWVALAHRHWGQKLHYSDDKGSTWESVTVPSFKGYYLPDGQPAALRQIWTIQQGGQDRPGHLWLGTDPGGLFLSKDYGNSFELVEGLWNHPSRQKNNQWFGAGSDYPFIHSIQVNPENSDHVYVAISCAGIFETTDGGKSWNPKNNGLVAAFLPNPKAEIGHDPHHLLMNLNDPKILWQQNHCGVFYTRDGGENWIDVSNHEGLPDYGFALAIDPQFPEKAWVIPVAGDDQRIAPDLQLQVFQTDDYGTSWNSVSDGLPNDDCFDIVLRQAFCRQGSFMAFGTTNGNLYYSEGETVSWKTITNHLTKINTIAIDPRTI